MGRVRAGVVQFDVVFGDVDANLEKAVEGVRRLAGEGADVVLLPEMWSSGFDYGRMDGHARRTHAILDHLGKIAAECRVAVAGSLPEVSENGVTNTLTLIDRHGRMVQKYSKIHLFSPGGEHDHFTGGRKAVVCDTDFGRVGFMICYDLRFPELCRKLVLSGATIILIAAQWPLSRQAHWETLVRARAIENQVFVIAANRCGKDERQPYAGHSMIVSPWGECLAKGGLDEADLLAELDSCEVARVRSAITCFNDRRPEVYGKES